MLTIALAGPDAYEARSGGQTLGRCRVRAEEDVTAITEVWLLDEGDGALLDGLVRTALFAGMEVGRPLGRVQAGVRERFGALLRAFPEGTFEVERLPRPCQK